MYNSFVAFVTKGSSIVPESDYVYNEVRQQLPNRKTYFTDLDEKSTLILDEVKVIPLN